MRKESRFQYSVWPVTMSQPVAHGAQQPRRYLHLVSAIADFIMTGEPRIAHTTNDWPRRISPQAKTLACEVW